MSLRSRITNLFRGHRLNSEIDDELQAHIDDAIEHGRNPEEARRAFGSILRHREASRDVRLVTWMESLLADARFGWRQLRKNRVTSIAAALSLALAIGSGTAAFRIVDAMLLRPLPIAEPERLHALLFQFRDSDGSLGTSYSCNYPMFRQMRMQVSGQAELLAIGDPDRIDLTYGSAADMEKAFFQFVSGDMFPLFRLTPAAGRLLTASDDRIPGAHPVAVISYDYWTRRFGRDPAALGRTFRIGTAIYEIVGVAPAGFTGTAPGIAIDVFAPTMMNASAIDEPNRRWFRTLVHLKPGVVAEPVRDRLQATFRAFQEELAKEFTSMPAQRLRQLIDREVILSPAPSGISELQKAYSRALGVLSALVALVLLIACANVANLMTAQAATRAREMALRISIGAGRRRLFQLVLVESALLALFASVGGVFFAWWSAPAVVSMLNPPDNPARLSLPVDWRVFAFSLALAFVVTVLLGLPPALRASGIRPLIAIKGGDSPHARRRLMHGLIAAQVSFCAVVLFLAGLFVASFNRLANQPTGFSAERILAMDTVSQPAQPPHVWFQAADRLRATPGVEMVALSGFPLMRGTGWDGFISVGGAAPGETRCSFLNVSPGWLDLMKIHRIGGRDVTRTDSYPGVAIVNEAFARQYFNGEDPIGKAFDRVNSGGLRLQFRVIGMVRDARYSSMREPAGPTAYVPFAFSGEKGLEPVDEATILVRTAAADPASLASTLRREVPRAAPALYASTIRSQQELINLHTLRERMLATLAMFFAGVALLLAGVGLYGVLNYFVLERRREIGIRMAIGAGASSIARRVVAQAFSVVAAGAAGGLALGALAVRYVQSLLFEVKAGDAGSLVLPLIAVLVAASVAALPAVIRAVRIDPVSMLRAD